MGLLWLKLTGPKDDKILVCANNIAYCLPSNDNMYTTVIMLSSEENPLFVKETLDEIVKLVSD